MLQKLLGAHVSQEGKKYHVLPPILFPDESQKKKDVFLNPALVRVSLSFQVFAMQCTNKL